jgi:hypothetical protein
MAAAYGPLNFAPGDAYQFDWSHEVVVLGGVTVTVKVQRAAISIVRTTRAHRRYAAGRAVDELRGARDCAGAHHLRADAGRPWRSPAARYRHHDLHQRPLADENATYDITGTLFGVGWSGAAVSPNFCSGKVDANGDCV